MSLLLQLYSCEFRSGLVNNKQRHNTWQHFIREARLIWLGLNPPFQHKTARISFKTGNCSSWDLVLTDGYDMYSFFKVCFYFQYLWIVNSKIYLHWLEHWKKTKTLFKWTLNVYYSKKLVTRVISIF